jgi:hypothetical protein
MMAAPLMAGNDLRDMSESTIRILTDPEAIAVNQDPLGIQGRIVRRNGKVSVWAGKPLFDGSQAVLVFNQGPSSEMTVIKLPELGLDWKTTIYMRDLWQHVTSSPLISPDGSLSVMVEPNDVKMFRISKSKDFPRPPVVIADTYVLSLRATGTSPQNLTGTITLTNKGSSELPLWKSTSEDVLIQCSPARERSGPGKALQGVFHAGVNIEDFVQPYDPKQEFELARDLGKLKLSAQALDGGVDADEFPHPEAVHEPYLFKIEENLPPSLIKIGFYGLVQGRTRDHHTRDIPFDIENDHVVNVPGFNVHENPPLLIIYQRPG